MKNKLLFFICCFCGYALSVSSQNLVENPGFAQFSSCPTGISEFYLCTDWSQATTVASDTCSTPDLYATCSSVIGGVNIPNCLLGYHQAYTGTGFAGQILGDGFPGCLPTGDDYREYIEGTLSTPLVAGNNYLVVVYMSLADQSMWGSNSYGVYFTNTQYIHDACPNSIINVTPQLEMCGPAIMDTVNWVPVQWIYTATGGEQYFTLGNFKDDANTNHVTHNCGSFNPYIYYYIGYVSISPVGPNDCGVTLILDSVNSTCGTNNGSVSVTASSCTSPYTYAWSTGATTPLVQNVGPGTYTVTVTDASSCKETASISVNSKPLSISENATNPSCGSSNGGASVSVVSGTGPYTYSWSNGGTTDTISNLGAGNYYVTVTGAAGCLAHDSISLLSSSGLTLSTITTAASCGGSNGSATAVVSGGTPPYTYSWNNGQTTDTAINLAPGTYTVTVLGDTAAAGPFWSEDFTSGGTGWTLNTPGTVSTNGSSANQWIVNTDANCTCGSGNYLHITVSSNSSCFICAAQAGQCTYLELASTFGEGDFTTDVLAISPVISTVGKSNIVLTFNWEALGTPGSDYGRVNLSADGGTTWTPLSQIFVDSENCSLATISIPIAYQNIANFRIAFEWINAAGSLGGAGNPPGFVIDNVALTAGAPSCPAIASATVPATGGLNVSLSPTNPSCGLNNGSITASVPGGSGSYTYSWNNGSSNQTISNLGAGSYTVTVSNTSGCSATANTSLFVGNGNISASPTATSATCGNNNGQVIANPSGGSGYTYLWSNTATTDTVNGLAPGNYTVTVTGTGGCTATASISVSTTNSITITPSSTSSTCGNDNGTATATPGSSGSYTYSWNNGGSTQTISNLAPGTYNVTVSETGCSATASVTVAAAGGLTITPTIHSTTCGNNNGSASVSVTGGSGNYSYSWSNNSSSQSISSLAAGTYTVTVNDGAGCSGTASVVINPSGNGGVTISPASQTVCPGDTVEICAPTGYANYAWNTGDTSHCILTTFTGNYYVTVTDNGGCTATSNQATVANFNPTPVTISVNGDTLTSYTAISYQWYLNGQPISGANGQVYVATQSGNYSVQITDNNGCHYLSSVTSITTAITNVAQEDYLRVYPNPLSAGNWHIDASAAIIGASYQLIDADGRLVAKGELKAAQTELSLNVASGVYMLQINSPQTNYNIKLIKL